MLTSTCPFEISNFQKILTWNAENSYFSPRWSAG